MLLRTLSTLIFLFLLTVARPVHRADAADSSEDDAVELITPAVSIGTGLLLEPALTLPEFTREKFVAAMHTVGSEKIHKQWTSPVIHFPPHSRADVKGLTHDEVKAYMMEAKRLFTEGKAVPLSDVGLISTQEDVIRQPMLNTSPPSPTRWFAPIYSFKKPKRTRNGPISPSRRTSL